VQTRRIEPLIRRFAPYAHNLERLADSLAALLGLLTAVLVRNIDGDVSYDLADLALFATLYIVTFRVAGWGEGLYRRRSRYGSFDEVASLTRTTAITTAVAVAVNSLTSPRLAPASVALLTGLFALAGMAGVRYAWRLLWEAVRVPRGQEVQRVLVVGAGEGGDQLIRSTRRDPNSPFLPVGLIDDAPRKRNLRISGVAVLGTRDDLAAVAAREGATAAVIAIPSAHASVVRELAEVIRQAGLDVLTLPPVGELLGQGVALTDVRPVTEVDLLGRSEVAIDIDAIAGYVTGRRVLVTGAGGSIGSELCRQLHRFAPERLIMLDHDESGMHATHLAIHGRALLDDADTIVADIRDRERVFEVFEATHPEVVFHAAALKHLPLLQMHPREAIKTNVTGTQHVLDAARSVGVREFVNISTDKAAAPTSVLGYSKRIAERLTAKAAVEAGEGHRFLSVRFGNVLGSRGSVLTAFRRQIEEGGPVTVTHPDVTRYFMTVEEAVRLVVQAGAIGESGHVLLLDMGEPVRIDDVARQLIASAHRPVEIVYTGLRPGEKLHEVLLGDDEHPVPSAHPRLTSVPVPLPCAEVLDLTDGAVQDPIARLAADALQR
jgi:FlaA1/EpsC-like NDP-sugar epimerase